MAFYLGVFIGGFVGAATLDLGRLHLTSPVYWHFQCRPNILDRTEDPADWARLELTLDMADLDVSTLPDLRNWECTTASKEYWK